MNLLEIVTKWVADTKPIDQAIDDTATKAETRMGRVGGAVQKGIGAGAKTLAAGGAVLFGVATKGAIDLQNATIDFQAATGATADEAEQAGQSINRLFGSNITTMGEASGVLAALKTNMGLTGQAAEDAAGRILDFSKVTGQDAVAAVSALDDLTDTYNLNSQQQSDVLDQLVTSQQKYGGSVTDNQAALAKLGPALTAANLNYGDGIGLLNLFAGAGIDASKAPAALTKALSKVKSPEELQKLIDDIRNTKDPFERAQKAADLFGAKAGPGLATALSKGGLDTFKVSADEAAGSVEKAADTIDSKLGNQVTLALNKAKAALAGFGTELGPAVTGIASLASLGAPLAKGLIGGLVPALAGVIPALGAGLSGLFAAAVPIAMAALPILLVVGIIAAIVFLINNPEIVAKIVDFAKGVVDFIVKGIGTLADALPGIVLGAFDAVMAALPGVLGAIVNLILQLPGMLIGLLGGLAGLWLKINQAILAIIGALVGRIVGFLLEVPGKIAPLVGQVLGVFGQVVAGAVTAVTGMVGQVVAFILSIPGRIAGLAGQVLGLYARIVTGAVTAISGMVGQVAAFILSIPGRVASFVPVLLGMVARLVAGFIGNVVRGAATIVSTILSIPGRVASLVGTLIAMAGRFAAGMAARVVALVGQVVGLFLGMPGRLASWVGTIMGQAGALASRLASTISSLVGSVVRFFLSIPGRIASIGGRIVSGIINGMASLPGRLADVVRNAFAGLRIDVGPFHISGSGVTIDLPHIDFPHFDVGTRFVPQDMLAVVHKGEAIIPAAYNPFASGTPQPTAFQAGQGGGGGDTINVNVPVTGILRAETPADLARPMRLLAASGASATRDAGAGSRCRPVANDDPGDPHRPHLRRRRHPAREPLDPPRHRLGPERRAADPRPGHDRARRPRADRAQPEGRRAGHHPRGWLQGTGSTEAVRMASYQNLRDEIEALFDPEAAPATLVGMAADGTWREIDARTVAVSWDPAPVNGVGQLSIALDAAADWQTTGGGS
jgi:hypothetical protein